METNEISEQAMELQIQVLEERNALLEKKIRRLTHRCQALERFYREIVVKQKGYLHPGMNVPVQEAGFNPRVLKRLEEGGMKVLGDLIFCQRRVYLLRGLGRKLFVRKEDIETAESEGTDQTYVATFKVRNPAVSYATVYPLSMFSRVIIAQIILMLFL